MASDSSREKLGIVIFAVIQGKKNLLYLEADAGDSILSLKKQIQKRRRIPHEGQHLTFKNIELQDSDTLEGSNIGDMDSLVMTVVKTNPQSDIEHFDIFTGTTSASSAEGHDMKSWEEQDAVDGDTFIEIFDNHSDKDMPSNI
jgi:hypothetical protein